MRFLSNCSISNQAGAAAGAKQRRRLGLLVPSKRRQAMQAAPRRRERCQAMQAARRRRKFFLGSCRTIHVYSIPRAARCAHQRTHYPPTYPRRIPQRWVPFFVWVLAAQNQVRLSHNLGRPHRWVRRPLPRLVMHTSARSARKIYSGAFPCHTHAAPHPPAPPLPRLPRAVRR